MKILLLMGLLLTACGDDDDDEQVPLVEYASLTVDASTDTEDGTYPLTSVSSCTLNSDSGLFVASLTGANGSSLSVRIKGFNTTGATYTCTQAAGNETGEVGQKFDQCSIELTIPDSSTGTNTYAMFRDLPTDRDLSYAGSCTIVSTYENSRVSGEITCNGLIQTQLQGSPRNPIEPSVTASISASSFSATILKNSNGMADSISHSKL